MRNFIIILLTSLFSQEEIEGRWIPGGFSNTMYIFQDNLRYTIYNIDGDFEDFGIDDAIPNPNPYEVEGNTISIDLFFGNTATYEMDFRCNGQVVDFYYYDDWEGLHSAMFREGFDYINSECNICEIYDEEYCSWLPGCQWDYDLAVCLDESNNPNECFDLSGIDFGECAMALGIGYANGECDFISGCDWQVDGVDYIDAFFNSMEECNEQCYISLTCDEIENEYNSFHSGEFAECEYDIDCLAVWGDCDVSLGGCHYAVNALNYPEEEVDELVDLWLENDCITAVCDCMDLPSAVCLSGECKSAYCSEPNPAGCFQTGCPEGYECLVNSNICEGSYCECDESLDYWWCTEDCGGGTCFPIHISGDVNNDAEINVIDIVELVGFILMLDEPTDHQFFAGDVNLDGQLNVLDVVAIVQLILYPINEDCYVEPEVGSCDGICPTYFFNQNTNECEEFITGCCGVEVFNSMENCISVCE